MTPTSQIPRTLVIFALLGAATFSGCGTIKGRTATEQLVVSDAVDQSIEQIDFSSLMGEEVFLDVQFIRAVRGVGFVNSEYIISSLRQRMINANCKLQESKDEAKYIVEVRIGALGSDCHEINYGVPGSQALNQTASLLSSAPLPSVPEISLARTDACRAAAKISLFAYERESRVPVWESGNAQGISIAKSTWVLGAGPFQKGAIYEDAAEMQTIELPDVQDPRFKQSMFAKFTPRFLRKNKSTDPQLPSALVAAAPIPRFQSVPEAAATASTPIAETAGLPATPDATPEVIQASATEPVIEEKPVEEKPVEEKPVEEKPVEEKPNAPPAQP